MVRLFEGVGDHERDRLSLMMHMIVLEHVQAFTNIRVHGAFVMPIGKPRRIAVGQNGDHTGRPFRRRAVDGSDPAIASVLRTIAPCATPGTSNSAA